MFTYHIRDRDKNHYGEITREQVREHAVKYLKEGWWAQNSEQMFHCILALLASNAFVKVVNVDNNYMLDMASEPYTDGPSFLKVIIDSAYMNTCSSSAIVHTNLSTLDNFMDNLKDSNIKLFHQYVKEMLRSWMLQEKLQMIC